MMFGFTGATTRPYFNLKVFIEPEDKNKTLRDKYVESFKKHNSSMIGYFSPDANAGALSKTYFDAGIDLFCPDEVNVQAHSFGNKLFHDIKCSMSKIENNSKVSVINELSVKCLSGLDNPVGYMLYPRSSTGTKTPLRLSNSVGIIDSGYRGDIIAAFDNNSDKDYQVEKFQRLVQICPPDLSYPIYVELVDTKAELGVTARGCGGFGSTGK